MVDTLAPDGLPPLRAVIDTYGLAARKSLGQNFLFDFNLTRRIARTAAPLETCTVLEVGPGPGGLTRALLMEGAHRVIAVERDERALPALEEIQQHYPDRLQIEIADALATDWRQLLRPPVKVVANLPYNIGTPLLVQWLSMEPWPPPYASLTLMFQREVAQRITAKPGESSFGRLSVLCQWRCHTAKLFDINRSAFTPAPKVTSSIVQLVPRAQLAVECSLHNLEKVTAAAFGQRRKMLRSSLQGLFKDVMSVLKPLGRDGTERAEDLSVEEFGQIARALDRETFSL